jgi:Ribbon-helix-helix protein, copG family
MPDLHRTRAGIEKAAPDQNGGSVRLGENAHSGCALRRAGVATSSAIMGYRWEVGMTDMLIRDVPDDVIAAVDARAARLGLSRSEYVRRRLAQDAAAAGSAVSTGDLARFAEVFSDLADPDVMSQAVARS